VVVLAPTAHVVPGMAGHVFDILPRPLVACFPVAPCPRINDAAGPIALTIDDDVALVLCHRAAVLTPEAVVDQFLSDLAGFMELSQSQITVLGVVCLL